MINGTSINGVMISPGAPQTTQVALSVTLERSSCRWDTVADVSTTWADQNAPATTWTEQSGCS